MGEQSINIAFVDDHDSVRIGIAGELCRSGKIKIIMEAQHGKEFLRKLEESDTIPDVCVLDINMPEMNGYETQKELASRYPQIRTLVLTAHKSEHAICKMINYGAKGYLVKNCEIKEIEEAIMSIYRNGIYHSKIADSSLFKAVTNKEIKIPAFSPVEMEVLRLLPSELPYEQIAKKLKITTRSVEGHRDLIFRKMGVNTRLAVVLNALELGLVTRYPD